MKFNLNDLQYIIEQATQIILSEGGRVVTLPSNDFDVVTTVDDKTGEEKEEIKHKYNVFYVDNPNEKEAPDAIDGEPYLTKNGQVRRATGAKHIFLEFNGETYELFETVPFKNNKGVENMYNVPPVYNQVETTANSFSTKKYIQQNFKFLKDKYGNQSMSILSFFMYLINNPLESVEFEYLTKKDKIAAPNRRVKKFYLLELALYYNLKTYQNTKYLLEHQVGTDDDKIISIIGNKAKLLVSNLNERLKNRGELKIQKYEPEAKTDFETTNYPVNTFNKDKNNGKGGLDYDVLNSINSKYRGFFEYEKGKKVEYINLSHFMMDTASFLKKGTTAKKQHAHNTTGIGNKMSYGDVNNPDVDMSLQDTTENAFFFNDNRTVRVGDDGKLYGTKEGDTVYGGNVLAEKLAEGMAYVVKEKMPNGVPSVILSIQSSGNYNKNTILQEYANNRDNMLYYLQNTFEKNVGNVKVAPDFFYKAGHLTEISRESNATPKDLEKVFVMQYFELLKKSQKDEALMEKTKYVGVGEKTEIILDNKTWWCDFSFTTNDVERLTDEKGNKVLRTFNGKTVDKWIEAKIYNAFEGWQIKSVPPYMRKYLSFWVKYSFDGTMLKLSDLKSAIKGSGKGQNGYDEADENEKMRMDDDSSNDGILVFDDNFASGATLTESCRLLVEYFNINPNRILALTPGWIGA